MPANRLRADKPARRVVKTSRWLLLRNRENVPDEQVVRLEELLAANKALLTVYLLKEDLKGLWRYRRAAWAWKAWKSWKRRALRSGLEPLRVFVRRLEPYLSGILAHCRWPLGTLAAFGSVERSNEHCPFCKLVRRYGTDARLQSSFATRPLIAPSDAQMGMLALLRNTRSTAATPSPRSTSDPDG